MKRLVAWRRSPPDRRARRSTAREIRHGLETTKRMDVLRDGLGGTLDDLDRRRLSAWRGPRLRLRKTGQRPDRVAVEEQGLTGTMGWYVGGDQEGVVAGRTAGLHTIRIGPAGEDHLSAVHRPDYLARDLMDAANRILLEEFGRLVGASWRSLRCRLEVGRSLAHEPPADGQQRGRDGQLDRVADQERPDAVLERPVQALARSRPSATARRRRRSRRCRGTSRRASRRCGDPSRAPPADRQAHRRAGNRSR